MENTKEQVNDLINCLEKIGFKSCGRAIEAKRINIVDYTDPYRYKVYCLEYSKNNLISFANFIQNEYIKYRHVLDNSDFYPVSYGSYILIQKREGQTKNGFKIYINVIIDKLKGIKNAKNNANGTSYGIK